MIIQQLPPSPTISSLSPDFLMNSKHIIVTPGYRVGTVFSDNGEVMTPPADWAFLPAGDAAVTRNVKAKGITWVVQVKKGKRTISKGVWANTKDIYAAKEEVEKRRSSPEYTRQRKQQQISKSKAHDKYVEVFFAQVMLFLNFHEKYKKTAEQIAKQVTEHATPVGSGTVARTARIPIEQRAEAAVIAWMRHRTTGYEGMRIARVKGRRREVRRQLAEKSKNILATYRQGNSVSHDCPLQKALDQ